MNDQFKMHPKIQRRFRERIVKAFLLGVSIFIISISIGIFGYHYIAGLGWIDAFLNASMILGGMGPVAELTTNFAKIFAGCYALFSGVAFISSMAIFLTPVIHWFLHKFHINVNDEEEN